MYTSYHNLLFKATMDTRQTYKQTNKETAIWTSLTHV